MGGIKSVWENRNIIELRFGEMVILHKEDISVYRGNTPLKYAVSGNRVLVRSNGLPFIIYYHREEFSSKPSFGYAELRTYYEHRPLLSILWLRAMRGVI